MSSVRSLLLYRSAKTMTDLLDYQKKLTNHKVTSRKRGRDDSNYKKELPRRKEWKPSPNGGSDTSPPSRSLPS